MKCYLIAKKLSHSFSKPIHNALADYSYEYKELDESELCDFFAEKDFDGLNVTIPYKTAVMQYLDEISPEAEKIGAVNTVVNRGGRLCGYNTDYYGFCYQIKESGAELKGKDVVILGSGGASKTVLCVCNDMGAKSVRTVSSAELRSGDVGKYLNGQIVVNATPVGMYPDTGIAPVDISEFKNCEAVLDLVYNPSCTKIIFDAKGCGIKAVNGLGMLVAQAKRACEIFTDRIIDDAEISKIRSQIEKETKNIVLVGMPGCGKSSVGKELARLLGREFFDSDDEITKRGETPAELIEKYGEEHFRSIESEVLSGLCKKSGCVIATGGGAVTKKCNEYVIKQNSFVVFINRPVKNLATDGRPLSQGGIERLEKLFKERLPLYRNICDIEVESMRSWQETAQAILNKR